MASFFVLHPVRWCLFSCSVLLFLCLFSNLQPISGNNSSDFEKLIHHHHRHHRHHQKRSHIEFQLASLLEQDNCTETAPSHKGKRRGGGPSLKIVHVHGPCARPKSSPATTTPTTSTSTSNSIIKPTHEEILQVDQYRVQSIRAQCAGNWRLPPNNRKSATLTARSGTVIGSGNYIVTVGLGTPEKKLSLAFDTGSDLTWIQCQPCVKLCYSQVDPIFDPSGSSSYTNISCTSNTCNDLIPATGVIPGCSTSTCVYGIKYGDSSFSVGFFATERLTLYPGEYIDDFQFGCGENNQGLFGGSAGLIGLGRNKLSLVSQAAHKYGNYFSYCLPIGSRATGHLTLGRGGTRARRFTYTPILTSRKNPTFYFVTIQAITVAGRLIPVPSTTLATAPTIIDSGTVITRLSPTIYYALRSAFRAFMSSHGYPTAPALSILDTCYDLSRYESISVPKVALIFSRRGVLDLDVSGILYAAKPSQVCLAFAGNNDDGDIQILGNSQQQTFDIVFDVDGGKIGFGPRGC